MTTNELYQAANQGDVDAMNAVAELYFKARQEEMALCWLEKAGNAGDREALSRAAFLAKKLAKESESADRWDSAVKFWEAYYLCRRTQAEEPGQIMDNRIEAEREMSESQYREALGLWHLGHFDLMLECLLLSAAGGEYAPGNPRAKKLLRFLEELLRK